MHACEPPFFVPVAKREILSSHPLHTLPRCCAVATTGTCGDNRHVCRGCRAVPASLGADGASLLPVYVPVCVCQVLAFGQVTVGDVDYYTIEYQSSSSRGDKHFISKVAIVGKQVPHARPPLLPPPCLLAPSPPSPPPWALLTPCCTASRLRPQTRLTVPRFPPFLSLPLAPLVGGGSLPNPSSSAASATTLTAPRCVNHSCMC